MQVDDAHLKQVEARLKTINNMATVQRTTKSQTPVSAVLLRHIAAERQLCVLLGVLQAAV